MSRLFMRDKASSPYRMLSHPAKKKGAAGRQTSTFHGSGLPPKRPAAGNIRKPKKEKHKKKR